MDIEKLNRINEDIKKCKYLDSHESACCNRLTKNPVTAEPGETQRILLVTNTPTFGKNSYREILSRTNAYFSKFLLSTFFKEYDRERAASDESYYDYYVQKFNKLVYWTHLSKCRLGEAENEDKTATDYCCAKLYLKEELEALTPSDSLVIIGKEPLKAVEDMFGVAVTKDNNLVLNINETDFDIFYLPYLMRKRRDDKKSTQQHKVTTKLIQELSKSRRCVAVGKD